MSRNHDELFEKYLDRNATASDATRAEEQEFVRLRQDLAALREQVPSCTLTFEGVKTELARRSRPRRSFAWGWALTPIAAAAFGILMLRNPQVMPNPAATLAEQPAAASSENYAAATEPTEPSVSVESIVPKSKPTFATVPATRTKQAPSPRTPSRRNASRPAVAKSSSWKVERPVDDIAPDMVASVPSMAVTEPRAMMKVDAEPTVIISRESDAQGTPMASEVEAQADVVVDG